MPSLETLIDQWRNSMRQKFDPDAVEEFENHLRESITHQMEAGKSAQDAFRQAAQELGAPAAISPEFDKIAATDWWAVKATLIFGIAWAAFCGVIFLRMSGRPLGWLLAPHVALITFGYFATYLSGALGIAFVAERYFSSFNHARLRSAARAATTYSGVAAILTAIATVLAMVWAKLAWGRFWAWDPKETGAFGILVWQVLFFCFGRSNLLPPRALMMLAILGNMVVSFGWFAPARSYSLLTGLLALHAAFLAAGFAPNRTFSSQTKAGSP